MTEAQGPRIDLTARLAYVNFDGEAALDRGLAIAVEDQAREALLDLLARS